MIILGIHGAIGHGKTTFGEYLHEVEPNSVKLESGNVIAEVLDELHWSLREPFADDTSAFVREWLNKLPPILKNLVGVETTEAELAFTEKEVADHPERFEKLFQHANNLRQHPELSREIISDENKSFYRAGLQGLGGYLVSKVRPTIWYDEIARRADAAKEQGKALCVIGGVRYPADAEVVRGIGGKIVEIVRPDMPEADSNDPTEAARKQIVSDTVVINDAAAGKLATVADILLADAAADTLLPTYTASQL